MASDVVVREGDVWRDLDPRGGPTFVVVDVCDAENGRCHYVAPVKTFHAHVTAQDGSRPRTVRLDRFRDGVNHRSGYTLVSRAVSTGEGPTTEP